MTQRAMLSMLTLQRHLVAFMVGDRGLSENWEIIKRFRIEFDEKTHALHALFVILAVSITRLRFEWYI